MPVFVSAAEVPTDLKSKTYVQEGKILKGYYLCRAALFQVVIMKVSTTLA